ncbi:hypothetical protein DV702_16600 [Sporosarcina sp. PTS2304]|uniref:hypothetical protein n=1 Tax=Sporosarcina sp. PTS2304 TaxID=2283194 RepID=UPI000E0D4C61|nr:hypothetical protein [Sporosarcina sp. PTS2304]AXI01198.1 hypothetical protein DV702_16600 [Sporosarcina sp. PTS2304]
MDVENEAGYSLQLYKDGMAEGEVVHVPADVTSFDFTAAMTAGGYYTATVQAMATGNLYSDGIHSEPSSENLNPNGLQPVVFFKNYNELPTTPNGLKNGGHGFQLGSYTYWLYDYMDNRSKVAVVARNLAGEIVRQWELGEDNIRYINGIQTSEINHTITFTTNQSSPGHPASITLLWSEFFIR